jgi:hypothetical protein
MEKFYLRKHLIIGIVILTLVLSIFPSCGTVTLELSPNKITDNYHRSKTLLSCDHSAFFLTEYLGCDLYEFLLDDPGNISCVCDEISFPNFLVGTTWSDDDVIYGSEYSMGVLYGIDSVLCDLYPIGGGGTGLSGITYDPTGDVLYACSSYGLYQIDPDDGGQAYIGSFGTGTAMIGIACNVYGELYVWDVKYDDDSYLYKVDKDSGEATYIGSMGLRFPFGLEGDFCMYDDILYLMGYMNLSGNIGTYLFECDVDTANVTVVGQFEVGVLGGVLSIPWDNLPPFPPTDPYPEDGAIDVSIQVEVNWTGGDPDSEDNVTYDLYFGDCPPTTKIASNITETSFVLPLLEENKTYCWMIVAWDNNGARRVGPIWTFTTAKQSPPSAPIIEGPKRGKPGIEYDYTFVSTDPDGDYVSYYIDWFSTGEGFWTDFYESGELITLPHTWPECGTFTIRAKAKDEYGQEGPWGYLVVTMPKNKQINFNLWQMKLFENFPFLKQIFNDFFGGVYK